MRDGRGNSESSDSGGLLEFETVLYVMLLLAAPCVWLAHVRDSLWLDETITFWVVKDSIAEAVRRAVEYQGQSPLYFLTAWLSVRIGGASEFFLRLPSLVAFGAATAFVAHIGMRLLGSRVGLAAAVLFGYGGFRGVAYEARPYALAILLVLASTTALLRWRSSGAIRDAVVYTVMASLVLYAHPLFGLIFLAHVVAIIEYRFEGASVVTPRVLLISQMVAALLALPIAIQIAWLWRLRGVLWFVPLPSMTYVIAAIGWPILLVGIVWLRERRWPPTIPLWVMVWSIAPPVILYVASIATHVTVAVGRYAYSAMPALALLAGAAVRGFPRAVRVAFVLCIVVAGVGTLAMKPVEDWRAAVDAARPLVVSAETPVLVRSGLPQALLTEWLEDPERAQNVLAPLSFYRVPGRILALPYDLNAAYLERQILPVILAAERFVILSHDLSIRDDKRIAIQAWFDARLPEFRSTEIARFDALIVVVYDRRVHLNGRPRS